MGVRRAAIEALRNLKQWLDAKTVATITASLEDEDEVVSRDSIEILRTVSKQLDPAMLQFLLARLSDGSNAAYQMLKIFYQRGLTLPSRGNGGLLSKIEDRLKGA